MLYVVAGRVGEEKKPTPKHVAVLCVCTCDGELFKLSTFHRIRSGNIASIVSYGTPRGQSGTKP